MLENKDELQISNELIKLIKPKLFLPIWNTVIFSAPPLNLLFDHSIDGYIQNPTIAIIMTIIAMTCLTFTWFWYVKEKKEFKKYEKKIPMAIHYLISQEESSIKDELIKLNDIPDTISRKELLKKVKNILDSINVN